MFNLHQREARLPFDEAQPPNSLTATTTSSKNRKKTVPYGGNER